MIIHLSKLRCFPCLNFLLIRNKAFIYLLSSLNITKAQAVTHKKMYIIKKLCKLIIQKKFNNIMTLILTVTKCSCSYLTFKTIKIILCMKVPFKFEMGNNCWHILELTRDDFHQMKTIIVVDIKMFMKGGSDYNFCLNKEV